MKKIFLVSFLFLKSSSLLALTINKIGFISVLSICSSTFFPTTFSQNSCAGDKKLFELFLKTDGWGDETEWELTGSNAQVIASEGDVNRGAEALDRNTEYERNYCLGAGSYTFTLKDGWGDGLADCSRYACGNYKISLDGAEIAAGEGMDYRHEVSHDFIVESSEFPPFTVRARGDNAARGEGVEEAFDGKLNTKWLDFRSTSWLQLQFDSEKKYTVIGYEISSANDAPNRDPKDWKLFGSNGGNLWRQIDSRTGVDFPNRFQTKSFTTNNQTPYNIYRLKINKNSGANLVQLSELKLILKEVGGGDLTCSNSQKKVTVALKTDSFPIDTSWDLKKVSNGQLIHSASESSYERNQEIEESFCLDPQQTYKFTINDSYGDSLCCQYGEGYYKVFVDGEEIISGGENMEKTQSYLIFSQNPTPGPVPSPTPPPTPNPDLSARDQEWLTAHNVRRKEWHENHNKEYVPLKWSAGLKADAKAYAEVLKETCDGPLQHAPGINQGENLARNQGTGSWANIPSAEQILTRFVENEADDDYPANGHLTQVIWRATHYVGCAESVKDLGGGKKCRHQVCRYIKPGNCNMGQYDDWKVPMLKDDSPCGANCPPEGCF